MAFPFSYVLSDSEVQVHLGGWICARLPYRNIKAIRVSAFFMGVTEKYPNLWPWPRTGVLIVKKSGLIPNFYVTPEQPELFVRELAEKSGTTDVTTTDPDAGRPFVAIWRGIGKYAVILALIGLLAAIMAVVATMQHTYH